MMRKNSCNILSFLIKPLLVAIIISGIFGLVYMRSGFLQLEYHLSYLEKKKMQCLRERKMLLAERTSLLSFAKFEGSRHGGDGFVLPERVKVMHMSKHKGVQPYKTSLERKDLAEP
jgi:hypothetical protein